MVNNKLQYKIYETIFNTKYFIINSKITVAVLTALCSRNRSIVLTYICVCIHTSSYLLKTEDDRQIPISTLYLACTNTHNLGSASFQHFHYIHTQVAVYWIFLWWWQTHIHTHPYSPLPTLDCLQNHTYSMWCISLSHLQDVSLTCIQHSTQLTYLFHQWLSRFRLYGETFERRAPVFFVLLEICFVYISDNVELNSWLLNPFNLCLSRLSSSICKNRFYSTILLFN